MPARTRPLPYKELGASQLRSFREVCNHGSYAAAARRLRLTAPAVWEQTKALERLFGVPLVERIGNGIRPTPPGQHLLTLISPVLASFDSIGATLREHGGILPQSFSILTNLRVLASEISEVMVAFHRQYPTVRLAVRYTGSEEIFPRVLEGAADIALTLEPRPNELANQSIGYEPIGEIDYLLVAPPNHPVLRKKNLRLEDIVKHPLVLSEPHAYSRGRVEEVFHRNDLIRSMNLVAETSSDEYTLCCVRAGLGIGITVGRASGSMYQDLSVRSLKNWFGMARIGLLWREGAHVRLIQQSMTTLLRSVFQ